MACRRKLRIHPTEDNLAAARAHPEYFSVRLMRKLERGKAVDLGINDDGSYGKRIREDIPKVVVVS